MKICLRLSTLSTLVVIVILGGGLAACQPVLPGSSGGLQLEQHALSAAPEPETFTFQPVEGTQEEILEKHASQRALVFAKEVTDMQGNPALPALGEASDLVAVLITEQDPPQQSVEVRRGDSLIFTADAGLPSPVLPLQGLWAYDSHWVLEILLANEDVWIGEVFLDGELVNQAREYDEAFGFQLLSKEPFFFYKRDGHLGYSYAGQETDIDYDQIPHYECCSGSTLNPVQAHDMVAFFAQQDREWFYVELGNFDS